MFVELALKWTTMATMNKQTNLNEIGFGRLTLC